MCFPIPRRQVVCPACVFLVHGDIELLPECVQATDRFHDLEEVLPKLILGDTFRPPRRGDAWRGWLRWGDVFQALSERVNARPVFTGGLALAGTDPESHVKPMEMLVVKLRLQIGGRWFTSE